MPLDSAMSCFLVKTLTDRFVLLAIIDSFGRERELRMGMWTNIFYTTSDLYTW
jgi:hypothetical protein